MGLQKFHKQKIIIFKSQHVFMNWRNGSRTGRKIWGIVLYVNLKISGIFNRIPTHEPVGEKTEPTSQRSWLQIPLKTIEILQVHIIWDNCSKLSCKCKNHSNYCPAQVRIIFFNSFQNCTSLRFFSFIIPFTGTELASQRSWFQITLKTPEIFQVHIWDNNNC